MLDPNSETYQYLENLFEDKFHMIFTSQPATIKSINASANTVNVTLDKEGYSLEDIPISLFGNPSSYIQTPTLENGTKGILIFSKHDLYSWVEDGVDSMAKTDFSKNNAFFLIGATNQKNKITYNPNAIEIKTNKAIEITSANDNSTISKKNINLTSTLSTNINCVDLNATASNSINLAAKNIVLNGSAKVDIFSAAVQIKAPSISLINSSNNEELFNVIGSLASDLEGLARELSISRDQTYNLTLTNSEALATYIEKFNTTAAKLKGFN